MGVTNKLGVRYKAFSGELDRKSESLWKPVEVDVSKVYNGMNYSVSCYHQTVAIAMYKLTLLETAYIGAMQIQGRQNSNMERGDRQNILLPYKRDID